MKIGIDFGSTYSTVSKYNPVNDSVEALHLEEGAPVSIPSAVSISTRNGTVSCGDVAKSRMGNPTFRVYDGFKMLLVEADPQIIATKKYTEDCSPRYITKCYLESILNGVLHRFGKKGETFEEVFICIPEIWCSNVSTLDGRNILSDILKNDVDVPIDKVSVVTEPESASAFFAHNYEKETGKSFNGHLLLIDYGGGTLDITLTQVISDGRGKMEIGYREGGGVGENHPDLTGNISLGNAGLAYLQAVLVTSLQDAGFTDIDCSDVRFKRAVVDFEKALKSVDGIRHIEDTFGEFGSYNNFDDIFDEDPLIFDSIAYGYDVIDITYQHLLRAYKQTIEKILNDEISDINRRVQNHIKRNPCKPESGEMDDFKIALVGGFGSFYLVKKQIAEIYNIVADNKNDMRFKNIRTDKSEQAISLGAALLASGRVNLQKTARYSIGLCTKGTDKKKHLYYGIKYHQLLETGKPYFICYNDNPKRRVIYTNLKNNLNEFAVGFSYEFNKFTKLPLKQGILKRLESLPVESLWYIGFSIDSNNVISVHILPYYTTQGANSEMKITLDSYANMFDMTAVREEDINDL